MFIDLIGFGIVIPLLPLYAKHFHAQQPGATHRPADGQFFGACSFCSHRCGAGFSDRIGRRPVLLIGLCGSVVFYLLFAVASLAESLPLLFVSRIGAGIAGATISTAHAYIADITSLENRTKGMAMIGAAFGLGFTLGPMFAWLAVDLKARARARTRLCGGQPVGRGAAAGLVSAPRIARSRPAARGAQMVRFRFAGRCLPHPVSGTAAADLVHLRVFLWQLREHAYRLLCVSVLISNFRKSAGHSPLSALC